MGSALGPSSDCVTESKHFCSHTSENVNSLFLFLSCPNCHHYSVTITITIIIIIFFTSLYPFDPPPPPPPLSFTVTSSSSSPLPNDIDQSVSLTHSHFLFPFTSVSNVAQVWSECTAATKYSWQPITFWELSVAKPCTCRLRRRRRRRSCCESFLRLLVIFSSRMRG